MKLDLKLAWTNIFKDSGWQGKLLVLIIFGLIACLQPTEEKLKAMMAANPAMLLLVVLSPILLFAITGLSSGYQARYLNNLIINKDAALPKWEKLFNMFWIGIKPGIVLILVTIPISIILGISKIISPALFSLLVFLAVIFCIIYVIYSAALYLCYAQNFKMWDILNFKKAQKYIGKTYFKYCLFIILAIIIFGVAAGIITVIYEPSANILTALFGVLFGLWTCNLLAQVHHIQVEKFESTDNNN